MRPHGALASILGACILCVAVAHGQDDEAVKKEWKGLEGTWLVTSGEQNGQATNRFDKDTLTIKDGNFTVRHEVKEVFKATIKLHPDKKPKALDVTITEGEEKGKTALGIYELKGDTLKLCFEKPGGADRPSEFATKEGSDRMVVVLKRQDK